MFQKEAPANVPPPPPLAAELNRDPSEIPQISTPSGQATTPHIAPKVTLHLRYIHVPYEATPLVTCRLETFCFNPL